jgi:cytochrome b6-f complex iron-sulfur subunit
MMGGKGNGHSTREPAGGASGTTAGRRRLLGWLWGALGIAALGELVWVTTSFLRPRGRKAVVESIFVAGSVDDFEPGSVTPFPAGRFYLVRLDDGGFLALDRACTHLGCTVPWDADEARFACPCHASVFDITGQVLSPPAPRPLDLYPLRIENSIVKVDLRRTIRRSSFDPTQVVRG